MNTTFHFLIKKMWSIITSITYTLNKFRLLLKGVTWNRDSHGLFDYEQRHPNKKQIQTEQEAKLVRVGCEI